MKKLVMTLPVKSLILRRDDSVLPGRYVVVKGSKEIRILIHANDFQNNAGDQNTEALKPATMLLKEMEEINNWARIGAQVYFGWFAVVLTFNGLATGWLFTHNGTLPRYTRMIFLIFIGLDVMGTIVTYFFRKHMLDSDQRIKEVIWMLDRQLVTGGPCSESQSPMPRQAIKTVFVFTGAALFMFLLFWVILFLWV